MTRVLIGMIGAALAATSMPAAAVQTVLTFDAAVMPGAVPACSTTSGGTTNTTCSHVGYIGSDYGSSGTLGVSYNPGGTAASLRAYVGYSTATSGGAFNWGGVEGADQFEFSTITFTPTAGNLVSFRELKSFAGSATEVNYDLEVRNSANMLLASYSGNTLGTFSANTGYYSGPLTLRFRNGSGGLVLDDITVDVIGDMTGGGVPEPAAWALMLGGFGMAGAAVRRRRNEVARVMA